MYRKKLAKYLEKHGLVKDIFPAIPFNNYHYAVVIPACAERERLPYALDSLFNIAGEDIIVLVNVNQAPDAGVEYIENNLATIQYLNSHSQAGKQLFWQDMCSCSFTGGVGMARKCGMDSILEFLNNGEALIFSLDADTVVDENYFSSAINAFAENQKAGGGVFSFKHQLTSDLKINEAIKYYEHYLDDYVQNLKRVNSPYAYHSIGSAMVFKVESYLKSGGMRIRSGGEDFYFMQALRKVTEIIEINDSQVHPASRLSQRVPFGTGPRLRKIITENKIDMYPKEAFEQLKILLDEVNSCQRLEILPQTIKIKVSERAWMFFADRSFTTQWAKILKNTPHNIESQKWAFHIWFDAFKTLKFIRLFL